MTTELIDILIEGECVAKQVPLEYCLLFVRGIFESFYNEKELSVVIRRSEEEADEGEWRVIDDDDAYTLYQCTVCKNQMFDCSTYKYCPNCGVKMKGKET